MTIVLFILMNLLASAEEERTALPLWELGLLGGAIQTPDYSGSNETRVRGIAFPNFRYRGKIFRSDENEGTRARLLRDPVYKIDFSFSGNFPVDSEDNEARKGMSNIDAVFEIGPRLKVLLTQSDENFRALELIFPLRAVYTTDLRYYQDRGVNFSPGIQWGVKKVLCPRCEIFFRMSALFSSERYSDLFYQVDPQYVTAGRPLFDGKGGFNSLDIFTGYAVRLGKVQAFTGVYYSNYSGTANRASPLFRQNSNTLLIFGLGWLFWESEERAFK